MKRTIIGILLFLVYGCGERHPVQQEANPPAGKHTPAQGRYRNLLAAFPQKEIDTLWVYSPKDLKGEYEGKVLDSAAAALFPLEIAKAHFADPPGLFAIYQFPLTGPFTGLLARTPDWYVPSSLKLFYYDRQRDTITAYVELAQNWGDAGDFHRKDAWVFRAADSSLRALVWFYQEHDHSIEDPADKTKTIRQSYALLNLSGPRADTLSKDSAALAAQFSHLTARLAANPY